MNQEILLLYYIILYYKMQSLLDESRKYFLRRDERKFKEKQNELRQILNKFDLVNYDEDEEKDELYNKYFDNLELFLLSEYEASPELTNRLVNEKISSFPFAGYKNPINHLLYFSELRDLRKQHIFPFNETIRGDFYAPRSNYKGEWYISTSNRIIDIIKLFIRFGAIVYKTETELITDQNVRTNVLINFEEDGWYNALTSRCLNELKFFLEFIPNKLEFLEKIKNQFESELSEINENRLYEDEEYENKFKERFRYLDYIIEKIDCFMHDSQFTNEQLLTEWRHHLDRPPFDWSAIDEWLANGQPLDSSAADEETVDEAKNENSWSSSSPSSVSPSYSSSYILQTNFSNSGGGYRVKNKMNYKSKKNIRRKQSRRRFSKRIK